MEYSPVVDNVEMLTAGQSVPGEMPNTAVDLVVQRRRDALVQICELFLKLD